MRLFPQALLNYPLDLGVGMDRPHDLDISAGRQRSHRVANVNDARPKVLATMGGDEDQSLLFIQGERCTTEFAASKSITSGKNGVDSGVARYPDSFAAGPLVQQVLRRP